jgi:hypothetical protein
MGKYLKFPTHKTRPPVEVTGEQPGDFLDNFNLEGIEIPEVTHEEQFDMTREHLIAEAVSRRELAKRITAYGDYVLKLPSE